MHCNRRGLNNAFDSTHFKSAFIIKASFLKSASVVEVVVRYNSMGVRYYGHLKVSLTFFRWVNP
jgi:hypothetical protein